VTKIRRLYEDWRAGSRDVQVHSRPVEGGRKHNIPIP
jgi:hypothetical protein